MASIVLVCVYVCWNQSQVIRVPDEKTNGKYIPSNKRYTFSYGDREAELLVPLVQFKAKVVEVLIKAKEEYPQYDIRTSFETEKYEVYQ